MEIVSTTVSKWSLSGLSTAAAAATVAPAADDDSGALAVKNGRRRWRWQPL